VLLSAWHFLLNQKSKKFFGDQFEQSTFYDQTTMMEASRHLAKNSKDPSRPPSSSQRPSYLVSHNKLQRKARKMDQSSYYDEEDPGYSQDEGEERRKRADKYCDENTLLEHSSESDDESSDESRG